MTPDLPTPLLRSLVAVVECGSLAGAAARVGRSESALSLQMAKLEEIAGQALFDRDGRALRLNRAGSLLLGHARAILARIDAARVDLSPGRQRPVRLGVVQDFVPTVLRPTLAELRMAAPGTGFEILVGSTVELLQAMGEDRIDTALCVGDLLRGELWVRIAMTWFGETSLLEEEVLPLVTITPPCPFLKAAQHALDAAGRPWRLAVSTPSLDGVRAAVGAGLGIACRTIAGIELPELTATGKLPVLPAVHYAVLERRQGADGPGPVAQIMARHLRALAGAIPVQE